VRWSDSSTFSIVRLAMNESWFVDQPKRSWRVVNRRNLTIRTGRRRLLLKLPPTRRADAAQASGRICAEPFARGPRRHRTSLDAHDAFRRGHGLGVQLRGGPEVDSRGRVLRGRRRRIPPRVRPADGIGPRRCALALANARTSTPHRRGHPRPARLLALSLAVRGTAPALPAFDPAPRSGPPLASSRSSPIP
jgi:hypothetical protein